MPRRTLLSFIFDRKQDDEVDREIAFHIEELTRANIAKDMPEMEARRQARIAFGGSEQVKQTLREVHSSALVESVGFHLRAALRFMRRSPSFSATVVLILAMGIGSNSAVFSAIDAVVLRQLPFPGGDQLVALYQHDVKNRDANRFVAPVRVEDWNRMNSSFQGISGYYLDDLSELSGPLPEKVTDALVAPRFLQVLGVAPMLGRNFTAEEEHFGGPVAALISYRFWQRRFDASPDVLDKKLRIGSSSYSIVGVMPASFQFPNRDVDLWTPSAPDAPFAQRRDATWFTVIGRMKAGVTLKQAAADLLTVQNQLGKQFAKPDADLTVQAVPLKDVIVGDTSSSLWLLYGGVSLLLLIVCSNIAALLLARTIDREHEISIRFSLGASRRAVMAQLLTEVFALALAGSLLGLLIAAAMSHAFHLFAKTLPRAEEVSLNWRVVLYSLAASVLTTIVCGLIPAIRGARPNLAHSLAQSGRTQVSSRTPIQWSLVGVQVALAVTLLVCAGLLLRSLEEVARVSPGFDASHVLTFQVSGSWGETTNMKGVVQRIDRTLDGLRSLPGVEAAATSGMLPGLPSLWQQEFKIDGKLDANHKIFADSRYISSGYFSTMRISVLAGEPCKQASTASDVMVNRSFANVYFNGTSPVGHQVEATSYNDFTPKGQIRGMVADAREEGLNTSPVPTFYSCFSTPTPFPNYLVRTQGDPSAMAETIRLRIHQLEPARSVYRIMPLQEQIDDVSLESRLRAGLLTMFAFSALVLACLGLYGTLSYLARLRQREMGVRLALGALPAQIVKTFLFQGLGVTLVGCAAGLILSLGADRLIANMLYGVSTLDPETYGAVLLLIILVGTGASLIPAWRSAQAQPAQVLRQE